MGGKRRISKHSWNESEKRRKEDRGRTWEVRGE